MWDCITTLVDEIRKCEKAEAITAAITMSYVCIDTMAFLSLPADQKTQRRDDFIAWVNTYLKGHPEQPYQYRGLDVYGARCALLHAFSVESDFHQHNPHAKKFGYHDGGKHSFDPAIDDKLVIIGTVSFINDLAYAIENFMNEIKSNADLKQRVEARLPQILNTFPLHEN